MKTVFVTGATGFVGSHLIERLSSAELSDKWNTLGLARSERKWKEFSLPGKPVLGDLSEESMKEWVSQLPKDLSHFIHTAGVVHSFDKEIFFKTNTQATISLFNLLKERFPKLHFIFISSLAAMGPSKIEEEHHEDNPQNPPSLYGQSKKQAEDFLCTHKPEQWSLTIIRPPMVIGPRDPAVLDVFKMVKGRIILESGLGGRNKLYSFVCVHDLVELIIKSLQDDHGGLESYFGAHPQKVTFQNIIEEISRLMEKKTYYLPIPFPLISGIAHGMNLVQKFVPLEFRLTPDKLHELKPMAWTCSGRKSEEKLNLSYEWDLKRTLETTLRDYLNRGWL